MTDTTTIEVPEDLIALELTRREQKADYEAQPEHRRCRYALYGTEQKLAAHPWLVARKADWRTARKALKQAADAAL
ncbi:MAG TPA: hypothetical protein VK547_09670 [Candidatus Udaeobacter sp.]|nr:hypothetical protein [Candidatus Udaeobacter sp.]